MPDLGIGEAIGGLLGGAGDFLGGLFGVGDAAAAAAPAAAAGAGAGLGALGTASDFLAAPTFDALAGGALAGTGADVASTAGSFLAAPGASLFGAGAAGIGGAAADAALSNAASTGLSSGTGSILAADAPTAAFNAAIPTAGFGAAAGAGGGATAANPFGATPNATPGVVSTGPQTTSAVPGLAGTTGPAGPAAPGSAVAPSGAGPGASDLTSVAGGGASATTPAASSSTGGLSGLVNNAIGQVEKNPLSLVGPAVGLGGLVYDVTQANKQLPEQTQLNQAALTATQQGNQLSSYLLNGNLPPGLQTAVTKATADAKTAAISNAAASGQPTDPSKNSTLASELAQIDQQATITTAQVGQQLLQSGLSETQLASNDYTTLLGADQTEQNLITQSISNFAKSLGGLGTSGLKLSVGT
jgi:hypothetical protein